MADTSAIKIACEEYIRVSKELAETAKNLSLVRKNRNELGDLILAFLRKNDSEGIGAADANLIMKDSKRTESMSKDLIKDVLQKHGLDADKIINDIQASRKTSVKQVISIKKK